jgi:hypothetical protein
MKPVGNTLMRRVSWAAFLLGLAWLIVAAGFTIADRRVEMEAFGPLPRELAAGIDGARFYFYATTPEGGAWDRFLVDGLYIELGTQERTENRRNEEWIPFGYRTRTDASDPEYRLTVVTCPSWLVGLLLVAPLSASTLRALIVRYSRSRRRCCLSCGYCLQGISSERCPECGLAYDGDRWWALRRTAGKPSRWRRGLYCACAITVAIPPFTAIGVLLSTVRYEWHIRYWSLSETGPLTEAGIGGGTACWMRTEWAPGYDSRFMDDYRGVRMEVSRPSKAVTYLHRPFDWELLLRYKGGRHVASGAVPLELIGVIALGWLYAMWVLHRIIQGRNRRRAALPDHVESGAPSSATLR